MIVLKLLFTILTRLGGRQEWRVLDQEQIIVRAGLYATRTK